MQSSNLPAADRMFERLFAEFNRLAGKNAEELARNADSVVTMTEHLLQLGQHTLHPQENITRLATAIEQQVDSVLSIDDKNHSVYYYMRAGILSSAAASAFAALAALDEKSENTLSLKPAAKGPAV